MKRKLTHSTGWITLWVMIALAIPAVVIGLSERHFFEVEHQHEEELLASLDIALGKVSVGKADDGYLFQAEVILENERLVPDFAYRVTGDRGRLDVDLSTVKDADDNVSLPDLESVKEAEWKLYFGDDVPIDLKFELGGTMSKLDLTGIPLRTLRLEMEASKGRVIFDEPNPIAMDYLRIKSGAAELSIAGLGYSRAQRMRFEGGMGKFELDFSQNADALVGTVADIEIGMAAIDIILPEGIPVVIDSPDSWFCAVDVPNHYRKADDGVWESPDYRTGEDAFMVNVDASVGKVSFATR